MTRGLRTPLLLSAAALLAIGCEGDGPRPPAGGDDLPTMSAAEVDGDTAFDLSEARTAIEARRDRFTEAHITGDTAFLNEIFADGARIHPPGAETVTGRDAIARLNAEYVAYGITEFREETTALYGNEQALIEEGTYVMTYGAEPTSEEGTYLNVWTRVGGDWKLRANIWNTDGPP